MKFISQTLLATIALAFSSSSFASLVTFDFVNNDTPEVLESIHFSESNLELSVYGWTTSFNGDGDQLEAWQPVTGDDLGIFYADLGLGLISNDNDGPLLDGGSSGNYASDPDEGFMLVFNQMVSLELLEFELDGSSDDININALNLDDTPFWDLSSGASDIKIPDNGITASDLGNTFVSNAFMVWLDGGNDDVVLRSVSVTAVPSPATWLLFTFGVFLCRSGRRG